MKSAQQMVSPVTLALSRHMAGAIRKPLPRPVAERAKLHLVDIFGAMISGSQLLPGVRAVEFIRTQGGVRESGVIGSRIVTSAINAAMANGMCGHADETDPTHPPSASHPECAIVPAALAIAERQQLSGKALLRAHVLGHDVCSRLLLAIKPIPFLRAGHHAGAFGQVFGAAAAAGALLGLDARRMRYLLSYAAQQASGLYSMFRDPEHIEKSYGTGGMPAQAGVRAALLVASGFTGVEDVFSGERDFFFTFAPDADREELIRELGRDHEIMRGGLKRWPVAGPIQGPLHVLRELITEHRLSADMVSEVRAYMPDKELEMVSNRDMPDTCVEHLLAVMLLDGQVTFASAHDNRRMRSPDVLRARKLIRTIGDPALTDPQRRWRCVMEIRLKDGRRLNHQTMAAKGSQENPLTRSEVEEKALDLLVPVIGARRSRRLLNALWNIENIADVRLLRPLYAN